MKNKKLSFIIATSLSSIMLVACSPAEQQTPEPPSRTSTSSEAPTQSGETNENDFWNVEDAEAAVVDINTYFNKAANVTFPSEIDLDNLPRLNTTQEYKDLLAPYLDDFMTTIDLSGMTENEINISYFTSTNQIQFVKKALQEQQATDFPSPLPKDLIFVDENTVVPDSSMLNEDPRYNFSFVRTDSGWKFDIRTSLLAAAQDEGHNTIDEFVMQLDEELAIDRAQSIG